MEKEDMYVGAKKNPDGSLDLSQAATFKPREKAPEAKGTSNLSPEQQKIIEANKNKGKAFFEALERGGGNVEVQEAKLKLKDLNEKLEMHRESDPNDHETIAHYEKEIALTQRVANGESLVKVLDSMQSEEAKKRIAETREKIKNMRQE